MKISEFQKLIENLYFERDRKRGIKNTFIWLMEEIGELAHILKNQEININNASEELADIMAWATSLANLLGIDLEDALFSKYPNMCIKCNSNPCVCGK
ncbi:MAG: MazG nucleotide pyrophosphohydrolase domain-containing protein [Promethearchaeota archaeon]|jgi:NTP pyrophosphatase (non-canonical NTP hydrolase)